ncbi:MAG: Abi family protein [Bacteroidales bacterium]|jgi:abortive infection bacteriophage resistance protein|nr:Abi family protein [Bacteroidales bacterium]
MEYTKRPLIIKEQIEQLKNRGLLINNEKSAESYLSNINYYRLRAYTFPFQDNQINDHRFLRDDIKFEDIIDLYCFDRRLRALIFNVLEKIEIALRTKFIYEYSIDTNNSHWFMDKSIYFDPDKQIITENGYITLYDLLMGKIKEDVKRSDEDFIQHYNQKYSYPVIPPVWMTLETLSFGNLSKLIANLDCKSEPYKKIALSLGLSNPLILKNWIYSFSVLRNYCAHHSRIWNRRFHVELKMPYNTKFPFIDKQDLNKIFKNKIFSILCCLQYINKIISPQSDFRNNLLEMIENGGKLVKTKDMGFPENWESFGVWQ